MNQLPNYLPGIPEMYGVKQPAPEFSQGNDVVVEFELYFNGEPIIDLTNWKLEAFVKKSLKANTVLWKAEIDHYLYQKDKRSNVFMLRIPADKTSTFLPGSYFFAVVGTQKVGSSQPFDRKITLHQAMFDLVLDAASPFPRLTTARITALYLDPIDRTYTLVTETTESTEPDPVSTII